MLILMFNTWLIRRRCHSEGNIISIKLIIVLGILFILTIGLTLFAFLQEHKKIKKYEEETDTTADQIKRTRQYDNKSFHYHLPVQIWIYVITIIGSIIAFAIYLY